MKRFYCTVCKRVRRVRNLPAIMNNAETIILPDGKINNFTQPENRHGICNKHTHPIEQPKTRKLREYAQKRGLPVMEVRTRKAGR